jgi:cytochrome c553
MSYWVSGVRLAAAALLLGGAAACSGAAATESGTSRVSGANLFGSCESCHGESAEGNAVIGAPPLAGLPAWYVSLQLERFQSGLRGKHPDDAEGLRMRAMASQMMSKAEIDAVAAHIASLPAPPKAPRALGGDPAAGESFYAVCAACHGAKGEGNQTMNAPPLSLFEDWYIARQLRKFQTGVRGRNAEDAIGLQMSGMAQTVPPESVDHVAAYVHELSK